MKVNIRLSLGLAILAVLQAGVLHAAEADGSQTPAETAVATGESACCDDACDPIREFAARVGVWSVTTTGSRNKTGEYQNLANSPFWDADGLLTNGNYTLDFYGTGTDGWTQNAYGRFYGGPGFSAKVNFDDYPHELDSKPFTGYQSFPSGQYFSNNPALPVNTFSPTPRTAPTVPYVYDDKTGGKDPAIRVQEFKANFKGNITDDLKWRVNVFGMEKTGDRQATAFAHCYQERLVSSQATASSNSTSVCHAVSQMQHIDWKTTEVEPGFEFRLSDDFTIEYSHTIRTFEQYDGVVLNDYNRAAPFGFSTATTVATPAPSHYVLGTDPNGTAGYAFVPNNTTQIDRLKIHVGIDCDTDVYGMGYMGDSNNEFRDINRHFGGGDLRITNRSIDTLTLTGYGKAYTETTQMPATALNTLYPTLASLYQEPTLDNVGVPINRDTDAVGATARWRPFLEEECTLRARMAITAGYEYSQIRRLNSGDSILNATTGPFVAGGVFTQPDSNANTCSVGVEEKWSTALTSYIRYKYIDTQYPLYGITPDVGNNVDAALNSALPTRENRVEIGGTFSPCEHLMLNATVYIEQASNHGPYVNFDSTSYPFIFSAMYAATSEWTLTAGFAEFRNWMNQDVSLAALGQVVPANGPAVNLPWLYTAKSDVINVGSSYAVTCKMKLTGEFEYVRGLNSSVAIVDPSKATPSAAGAKYDLGPYTLVSTDSYQVSAGIDYQVLPRMNTYFRYNYYKFGDLSTGLTSGTTHMFLTGVTAVF